MDNQTHIPGEIVETYRPPDTPEIVEVYRRPLPWVKQPRPAEVSIPQQPKRKRKTGLWIFLACLALTGALAAGIRFVYPHIAWHGRGDPFVYDFNQPDDRDEGPKAITIPTYPTGQGVRLTVERDHGRRLTIQEVYQTVNPAVVAVMADLDDGSMSVGTGVIFTDDGYILTNYHVVEGGSECTVSLDSGRGYEAKYVAGDADSDLAVLKVDASGLPTAAFGDSDRLIVGDQVYAIGNPLGMELRGTLTDGIVSAINRDVWVEGRTMTLIQTNAALNSGNSGGPLINEYGQVVGINTIKMTSSYSNIEGLGFAIPSSTMDRLVNDLLTYGKIQPEPRLGVTVSRTGEQVEEGLWGIRVEDVTPGSAADLAGIRTGDYILTADGSEILSSQDLLRIRRQHYVGDSLSMTLWRDGEIVEVLLILSQS